MLPQFGENPRPASSPESLNPLRPLDKLPTFAVPKIVILCFQNHFLKQMLEEFPHRQCDGCFSKLFFLDDYPSIAIGSFTGDTRTVAANIEKLITWGVEQFISIGT